MNFGSFAFSCIFSLCVFLFVIKEKSINYKNNQINLFERKCAENLLLKLETTPDNEVIEALLQVLLANGISAKKVKNHLESKNSVYLFNFDKETSRTKICYFLRGFCNKKIYLFCNKPSEDCANLLKNFKHKIIIIDAKKVYSLFKNAKVEFLNDINYSANQTFKLKAFLNKFFTKKRAINFTLISGCLLLFSSFTFFPIYYRICALISAIFAVICLLFGLKDNHFETSVFVFED